MEPVKRVEIIINSLELEKVLTALDKVGISGYTIVRNVIGKSARGQAFDDLAMTALSNVYILVICPETQVEQISIGIRPILKKFGGISLVSDAQWLVH